MCGIAGVLWHDPQADTTAVLERLSGALHHRGPDASGLWFTRGRSVGLAHRRLSIVDLAGGAQPMANEDGSVQVSFNGEIYNHQALRMELQRQGHVFRTRADTEVLVHGWEAWGPELPSRLNGIFAFIILDTRGAGAVPRLFLARDPVGAKPLYLGRDRRGWWAASELQAARDAGLVDGGLRRDAMAEFLVYRFIPSPGTPFERVWKVPPGASAFLPDTPDEAEPEFRPYEYQAAVTAAPRTAEDWADALRHGIREAVSRQLMADVPVGSLLSGGVDSVLVTSLMTEASGGRPPQCFGIGFPDVPAGGELTAARRAAKALGAPLIAVAADEDTYLGAWPGQIATMGEPIANSGVLLVGLLCASVARTHKVVLSGQGADEPLGGYPRHAAERLQHVARWLQPAIRRMPERWLASDRVDRLRRIGGHAQESRRFTELLAVFAPDGVAAMMPGIDAEALTAPMSRALARHDGTDSLNRLLSADAQLSLADDLLLVADHMSMAHSVELRVPFLDLEFMALVSRMPSRFKVSMLGERKWLYRKAVAPLLPRSLRASLVGSRARLGRKFGFATPLDRWFAEWAARDAGRQLLGPAARLPAVMDPRALAGLVQSVVVGGRPRARQLLSLFVLETWLRSLDGLAPAGLA